MHGRCGSGWEKSDELGGGTGVSPVSSIAAGRGRPALPSDLLFVAVLFFVFALLYDSGLASLLPHLVEFLAGGIECFLLAFDVAFVLRVFLIPLGGISQAAARIALHCGRAQTIPPLVGIGGVGSGNGFFLFVGGVFF